MLVDITSSIVIDRPRDEVAAYASDLDHTTDWYTNIKSVAWLTERPIRVGSRVRFTASFMGRNITYTYDVREFVPLERLTMNTDQGPFPMETTYTWEDAAPAGTRMTLRNRGEPAGFSKVTAPAMRKAMRRANQKDLQLLKELVEGTGAR